ncbi:hypothetical protein [Apibacter adventoris]|uniref:Uncharacterized protein n=1 Tax=Apibacter adventoris TaxID=1679466 RepID=A0A2S8AEG1_9FLAO|nr:hypothetical protein [Apibacter adventoris]PQL93489.1 hypothetical protein C4S77_04925 [Apibacter adventoris]PQL94663.1 hypothetical protein C4S76_04315 [Apibacter adventoris]
MKLTDLPKNKPVITTTFVINENKDIVYVSLDKDNDLQMFSEEGAIMKEAIIVSLDEILLKDSSLASINIEKNESVYRQNKNSLWTKQ